MVARFLAAAAIVALLALPALSELVCDVKSDCGCPSDGKTDGTDCVRRCVEACHEKAPDRAIVRFADGVFLTGAFNLTSNMTLLVEASAVILASTDPKHFPVVPALPSYGTCRDDGYPKRHELFRHQAFISGWNIENVEILGGGVIDGQGDPWWAKHHAGTLDYGRPRLIEPMYCTNLRIANVSLRNSPFWTVHPYACDTVTVQGVNISAPSSAANTDGIDPDSTSNVLIENCIISVGDDAIAIKSGMDYAGRQFNRSTHNVLIRNCWFINKHVSIGSEQSGGVRNVTVENCTLGPHPDAGIHLKSERGRGGYIDDVVFRDLVILNASEAISVSMFYSDSRPPTNRTATPTFTNLYFQNISGANIRAAGELTGLPESKINGVHFQSVKLASSSGWHCTNAINVQQFDTDPRVSC